MTREEYRKIKREFADEVIAHNTRNGFDGNPIKIDFQDGSAIPKSVEGFIKIRNPDTLYLSEEENRLNKEKNKSNEETKKAKTGVYRSVYYVDNWRTKIIEVLENAVRSYLATLTIDEALPKRRGGYNLLDENRIPKEETQIIRNTIEGYGLEL
jgi:mRNA-degrading endonuclease RelE of RelBE toxin-antitoxin system